MGDVPQTGTVLQGIGNEVILAFSCLAGVITCYLGGSLWLKRAQHRLYTDTTLAVQSTRRDMGVESREPPAALNGTQDSCPVCLGTLEGPVETNCGHRFCAQCVLEYWRHDQWPNAARCPVCRRAVTLLLGATDSEDVQDYNERMSGEWRPLHHYLYDVPTIIQHLWRELFSDRGPFLVRRLYLVYIAIVLLVYLLSPFDILPEAVFGFLGLLDDLLIILITVVCISFLYRTVLVERR